MDIEKIIQNFEKRIAILENQVNELQDKLLSPTRKPIVNAMKLGPIRKKLTRTESRKYAINQLEKYNEGLIATKANREEGSGIVLSSRVNERTQLAKFYHSYCKKDDKMSASFKVSVDALENNFVEYFIFNVLWRGKIYSFAFNHPEFYDVLGNKRPDRNGDFHLNFEMYKDEFFDVRNKKLHGGNFNITRFLDKWRIEKF